MSPDQVIYFQSILSGHTELYGGLGSEHVRTTVDVFNQAELGRNNTRLAVDYTIEWSSNKTDVNGTLPYDLRFISWMEQPQNSAIFVFDLRDVGIMIENSNTIDILNPPEPSLSPQASNTGIPSPTQAQPPSYPTSGPITGGISRTMVIIIGISGSMGAIVFATGVCLIVWARRNSQYQTRTTVSTNKPVGDGDEDSYNGGPQIVLGHGIPAADGVKSRDDSMNGVPQELEPDNSLPINDSESLASEPSMLSGVKSIESSSDFDNDVPDHLIDELDDNMGNDKLEKMRAGVEGNVGDVDEMMSQALIKALTEDYDGGRDMGGLLWGGNGDGMEIEASVLCETNDWLKRKEGASLEERRMFMQDILNRMVATVRHNVIAPERGSTAIHGAAAMLGLQLAGELPETAILVSGMRHKVQKEDLYAAFSEFGEIEGCAVAPNAKGFGLVRYKSPKAVQRALERYRTNNIDVQDVSVNVRVLSAQSTPTVEVVRQVISDPQAQGIRSAQVPAGGRANPRERGRGVMETNQLPALETIDYPSDSLGRQGEIVRRQRDRRGPGSESGRSDRSGDRSRSSAKSQNSRRAYNGP